MSEETFARGLERHAEQVEDAPLTLDAVRGRALRIRRRRRTVAVVAAAAVVAAIVVPIALVRGDDRAVEPAPDLSHRGASVLHDGVLTAPDGSTVPLDVDNADVTDLAVLSDGRIVLALQRPYAVQVYSESGVLTDSYDVAANTLTASPDDTAVAWVADDYRVRVLSSGADEPDALPGIPMAGEAVGSIDAVLDAEHLLVGDYSTTTGEITPDGYQRLRTSEPLRVTDVDPAGTLWAVQYPDESDPQFGCSGLYDPASDQITARTCETGSLRFSPDGEHLLGSRGDNSMAGTVDVLDRDLARVGLIDPGRPEVVSRYGWADATHVLLGVVDLDDSRWSLVRFGVENGEEEVLEAPADGRNPETVAEYLFSG